AEADMAGRGIDRLRMTRGGAVAPAVIRRAQMRAALENLARDRGPGLGEIMAAYGRELAGILRDAAGFGRIGSVAAGPEIRGPFPDIADHVVKPVAIGRKGPDRRGQRPAVALEVLVRKPALPKIGQVT